jgi:hypothetical protein
VKSTRGGGRGTLKLFRQLAQHCLDRGITSPQAEDLLRRVMVHAARGQLLRERARGPVGRDRPGRGRAPNVRVARLSGVHRNFVARILAVPPDLRLRPAAIAPRAGRRR